MNPNTPPPTAEELAIRQRDFLASDGPTFYSWQELEPPIRALWQKSLQAVLDHLKPWLKEEAPYNCPPIAKQRQEAMVQTTQQADKCPVETPPGYVAMRGKDLPDKMPYYSAVLNAYGEWEVCTAGGLRGVGAFNATQWYAIPAPKGPQLPAVVRQMAKDIGWGSKEPQPPDWITDPAKAMECAECPTFLNAVARIKELEEQVRAEQSLNRTLEDERDTLHNRLGVAEKQAKGLPWVALSERKPTKEDADEDNCVLWCVDNQWLKSHYSSIHTDGRTHFIPFSPPPAPKPEDHRREVFEKAFAGFYDFLKDFTGEYVSPETRQAWTVWQRAIVETENKTQP